MSRLSMYERVMGDSYPLLPLAVQRFHRLAGKTVLHGWVETAAPTSTIARILARCLGSPLQASRGPIRFELDAGPATESWTRHFPAHTMSSRLQLVAGRVEEQLGAVRLLFELTAGSGSLTMHLTRMRFLGIPCPRWLMPRIVAEEVGEDERIYFRVSAAVPGVGIVASYYGHLVVDAGRTT